jgi:hypothetical protein
MIKISGVTALIAAVFFTSAVLGAEVKVPPVKVSSICNHASPFGATARCRDGWYSCSQHRPGTCSWHGGVAEWYPK